MTLSALVYALCLVKSMMGGTGLIGLIFMVNSFTMTTSLSWPGYSLVINHSGPCIQLLLLSLLGVQPLDTKSAGLSLVGTQYMLISNEITIVCISATLLATNTSLSSLLLFIQDNATLLSNHRKNLLIEYCE